jgi:hypothetical protein
VPLCPKRDSALQFADKFLKDELLDANAAIWLRRDELRQRLLSVTDAN